MPQRARTHKWSDAEKETEKVEDVKEERETNIVTLTKVAFCRCFGHIFRCKMCLSVFFFVCYSISSFRRCEQNSSPVIEKFRTKGLRLLDVTHEKIRWLSWRVYVKSRKKNRSRSLVNHLVRLLCATFMFIPCVCVLKCTRSTGTQPIWQHRCSIRVFTPNQSESERERKKE